MAEGRVDVDADAEHRCGLGREEKEGSRIPLTRGSGDGSARRRQVEEIKKEGAPAYEL